MRAWMRLLFAAIAVGGIAAGARFALHAAPDREHVPTFTVATTPFVRRVTTDGNLRALKATPIGAPHQGDKPMKIAWLAPDGELVKANTVVVRFDPSDGEKALRDGNNDFESASAKLREEKIRAAAAVADRDSAAVLAQQDLDQTRQFQAKDPTIYARNDIVESEIDEKLAGAKHDNAEQAKTIERHLSTSNAGVIAVEQQKAQIAITHAKSDLALLEVRAPHDGIFVLERDWHGDPPRVGAVLYPGQGVAELPLLDTMEAELFVLEVEGTGLAVGQPADVVIEARPDLVYHGKIRLVDKLAKPRQPGVPVQYFAVVVAFDKTDGDVMKPGQRVHGTLILDQENALVVPREAVFDRDGKTLVYRRRAAGNGGGADAWEPIVVELGAATAGRVVIKSGLAAGDVIALRDPTRSLDQALGSGSASGPAAPTVPGAGPR